ncbi:MAG: tetratricopeptide repeat protein [Gemmatimonadetes bacterium]|nr:tetratricopeptide repeat protein [Gemmatimonadota bacterium]
MRSTLALVLTLAAVAAAPPLQAQRDAQTPRRPALASADTNDARAYLQFAAQNLNGRPREAADAYWWAYQLDPTSSDALYGRHAALLMSVPSRLVGYWNGERRVVRSREVQAIDSLYFRALTMNPFMYREHEHHVFRLYLRTWARDVIDRSRGGHSVSEAVINEWINDVMHNGSPYMKAREAYSQRRFPDALRLMDEAYREARSRSRSWLRAERARLLAHTGNNPAALADFASAIADMRGGDERELVFVYESKALLEHAVGMLHERMGNVDAAREAYGRALTEDLAFYPAHVRLGLLALAAGDTATAVGELDLAAQAAGPDPSVHYTYGAVLAQLGRLDEAAAQLTRASELAPFYADPWFALGVVRDGEANVDGARQAYQAFLARAAASHRRRAAAEQRLRDLGASPEPAGGR